MPIALMLPFAEAAGITLAGLGMQKATELIMNYIQTNPEKSKQILETISPLGGLGSILMNKESEKETSSEPEKKEGRSKKEVVLDAIREGRAGRGNYSSPEATGPATSIRGNVIRGLEDEGYVSKERVAPGEKGKSKEPFDYKKFYKADGGLITMFRGKL